MKFSRSHISSIIALIVLLSLSSAVLGKGGLGNVNPTVAKINVLEARQKTILEHVRKIDGYFAKYETFAAGFKDRVTSLIEKGAQCVRLKGLANYHKERFGASSDSSRMYARLYGDCEVMRQARLQSLKNLKQRLNKLGEMIEELKIQKEISLEEARIIRSDIEELRKDLRLIESYQ